MIPAIILSVIALLLLLLALVLFCPFSFRIRYCNGTYEISRKFLFFRSVMLPSSPRRAHISKPRKKRSLREKEAADDSSKKKTHSSSPLGIIKLVGRLLKLFHDKFRRKLHIRVDKLFITVTAEDAAHCALLYGTVSQSTAFLLELIDNYFILKAGKRSSVRVDADFAGRDSKIDIDITIFVKGFLVLHFLLHARKDLSAQFQSKTNIINTNTEDKFNGSKQSQ